MSRYQGRAWLVGIVAMVAVPAARPAPEPVVDEFLSFLNTERIAESSSGLMVCQFGFGEHTAELSRRILAELAPPRFRAHVAFFHQPGSAHEAIQALLAAFPERAHAPETVEAFGARCSVVLLSVEDPRFTAETIRRAAGGSMAILGYLSADCSGQRSYACRFFHTAWDSLVGGAATCGRHFCTALVPTAGMDDPLLSSVDCDMLLDSARPPSTSSQWQQDWFVYHNFVRGTALDAVLHAEGDEAPSRQASARQGVFVDIGAFHPIHLSNTFFFERCLGWRGLCAEPNPSWAPYFSAYRPDCQLVPNCVWSKPRSVVMSFQKDPIEAYIQDDSGSTGGNSGAVLIDGNGTRPRFAAECRTLDDILSSAGLRRPAVIDYMSVDAEAAEVEIFRDFRFGEFDVSVVSVEVQAQNYYELDAIFFSAGYAKLAVLGGDHVYAKLQRGLIPPQGAASWHRTIARDFHAHAPAKSELGKGR
mmetsp:Transcript_139870/g.389799  ORF Transcript_139870/g.389799 Transcript_139870/m.389799 type:complete len:475 (-) Transcript_139870:43-1467(-)